MATSWVQVGALTNTGNLPPYINEAGGLERQTLALLNADLAHAAGTLAFVYADPTPSNIGKYIKAGDPGEGSWVYVVPFSTVPFASNNQVELTGTYTVIAADAYCYREFDTSAADCIVIFDPNDSTIPDTTEVMFRKTSPNHLLYITTDGTTNNPVHVEQTLKKFSVRKVGTTLVL